MKILSRGAGILVLAFFISFTGFSQLSGGGQPWSFTAQGISGTYERVSINAPDADSLIREDALSGDDYKNERFAILLPVGLNPFESGTWESLKNGDRIWRLQLSIDGSSGSSLYFEDFKLPGRVKLYLYDPGLEQIKGAFTEQNNRDNGLFATELLRGGSVVLELNVPAGITPGNWFTITDMSFGYTGDPGLGSKGFGTSQFCEVNVSCSPEGDNWQDEKRGVVKIKVRVNGSESWCSGSLVNNTNQDQIPYLLTADHCAYKFGKYATPEDLATWVFYFNYESTTCENPLLEPQWITLTGCTKVANDGTHGMDGSDFYLVKLMDNIPTSYKVYFNGWSRVDVPSSSGVTIHHPDGDIKKISTYLDTPESSDWQNNGLDSHWKVFWAETENNWGVTEGGSSGAPLFDNLGRIVGTLTGGLASCSSPELPDYYGKLAYHWESNGTDDTLQLKPWLDPGNTGVLSLGGMTMGEGEYAVNSRIGMNVFPNPVDDLLHITFNTPGNHDFHIEIIDLLGGIKVQEDFSGQHECTIRVGYLPHGIYFVRKSGGYHDEVIKIMKR